ncbi:unnamed protein product [Peronospora belbahrii]|uniref:Protein kinase domain-containing protein n=1 Tax=Peronospora belbahrii TaxID=622444 RepID=A0AAU9LCE1_9STRA|nr:unnamed protein product [Peronospora belbahrii]CAH0519478.1 unnamed protein product [Peronospora belbahrii]
MRRSTRTARSYAIRLSWQRQVPVVLKVSTVLCVIGFFFWNISTIVQHLQSGTSLLRSESSEEIKDIIVNDIADRDSEEAWWLDPETYRTEDGCDFSAAVALFKPEELELNCGNMDQLQYGEFVGKGYWRNVFKTTWNGQDVAVKVVKEKLMNRSDIISRHVEECASIFSIRNEPNIVRLVGWCMTTVVVDYLPHHLDELLFMSNDSISVHHALKLALDATRGVVQLHNALGGPYAHSDLQPRQFLIDANGTLKLNDFNRIKYTGPRLIDGVPSSEKCTFTTSVAKGKWRSPEEYQDLELDEKLDIYSLSLVLWALRARVKPFWMLEKADVYKQVPKGLRPSVEEMSDYPQPMQDLIIRGWDNDPTKRPSAQEMADEIESILASYKDSDVN